MALAVHAVDLIAGAPPIVHEIKILYPKTTTIADVVAMHQKYRILPGRLDQAVSRKHHRKCFAQSCHRACEAVDTVQNGQYHPDRNSTCSGGAKSLN
jgi:hypothetical protein